MANTPVLLVRVALPLALALASQPLTGQDLSASRLRLKDTVPVHSQDLGPLILQVPVKCDADANVYLRKYQLTDFEATPIVKISQEGKPEATFEIRSAPGFEKGAAYDFAVGLQGEVYLLAAKRIGEWHIVKFNPDGRYDSTFTLEPFLEPRQLAVFPSGEFLVSGKELSEKDKEPTGKLLTAIYDRLGRLMWEVSLPRDVEAGLEEAQAVALSLTTAVAADDGNIYLMRATASPRVYVISPGGSVLRRLVIPPPAEDFRPITMKTAGGRIAIQFEEDSPAGTGALELFSVVDAQTGEKFADYLSTPETGGTFACYTPSGFTFLATRGEPLRLTIIQATPY